MIFYQKGDIKLLISEQEGRFWNIGQTITQHRLKTIISEILNKEVEIDALSMKQMESETVECLNMKVNGNDQRV